MLLFCSLDSSANIMVNLVVGIVSLYIMYGFVKPFLIRYVFELAAQTPMYCMFKSGSFHHSK